MMNPQSLDFSYIKKSRGRLCAYIMGLIAAFMGMHIAAIEALTVFSGSWFYSYTDYGENTVIIIMVLVLLLSVVNIIGAFLIRPKRIAGGVIMLSASVPLFAVAVIDQDLLTIIGVTAFVGIAAAIIAFVPLSDKFIAEHIARVRYQESMKAYLSSQPYQQQYQPYQQPPAQPYQQPYQPPAPQQEQEAIQIQELPEEKSSLSDTDW